MDFFKVALSDLVKRAEEYSSDDINAYITPDAKDGFVKSINHVKRKDIILEFLDILCYPGALIKKIDISINVSTLEERAGLLFISLWSLLYAQLIID